MVSNTIHFGIGIDTARYGHHASFLDEQKRTAAKPCHFTEDHAGYQVLLAALEKLQSRGADVHLRIRLDAAGQFADNLITWLHQRTLHQATIGVGKPDKNEAYRRAHYDRRKADPVESLACARFAVVERPNATPVTSPEFASLLSTISALESSAKTQTRLADKLHASAKVSTASALSEIDEALITQKVRELLDAQEVHEKLLKIAENAWNSLPEGPHQRVLTIKGIGIQTASALVAKNNDCCRSCGSQGNVLDLLAVATGQPLFDAAWNWIDQHHLEPPTLIKKKTVQPNQKT